MKTEREVQEGNQTERVGRTEYYAFDARETLHRKLEGLPDVRPFAPLVELKIDFSDQYLKKQKKAE